MKTVCVGNNGSYICQFCLWGQPHLITIPSEQCSHNVPLSLELRPLFSLALQLQTVFYLDKGVSRCNNSIE